MSIEHQLSSPSHDIAITSSAQQPSSCFTKNGITVVVLGFVTNKASLSKAYLNKTNSTAEAVYEHYLCAGDAFIKDLCGDFQAYVLDTKKHCCYVYLSPYTTHNIFYARKNKKFIISNCFSAIKKKINKLTLDKTNIGKRFVLQRESLNKTCYNEVSKITPCHLYQFQGSSLKKTYIQIKKPNFTIAKKTDEITEQFKSVFYEAVNDYLPQHGKIASHLSGGLDSTSITAVAADILKKQKINLLAVSALTDEKSKQLPEKTKFNNDDRNLVLDTLKQKDNLHLHTVYCNNPKLTLTSLANFCYEYCDGPADEPINCGYLSRIHYDLNALSCHHLLTGFAGNLTISFSGDKKPHWMSILRFLKQRYLFQFSRHYDIRHNFLVSEKAIKKYKLKAEKNQIIANRKLKNIHNQQQLATFNHPSFLDGLSQYYNISMYDPSAHPKIIALCLALPNNAFYRKGLARRLIRDSMRNIIPESVRLNEKRGLQGVSWFYQLKQSANFFLNLMPELRKNDFINELLNLDEINKRLNEIKHCNPHKFDMNYLYFHYRFTLIRALHYAHWIYLHDSAQQYKPIFSTTKKADVDLVTL